MTKIPAVPRIYVADVSLLWTLMWFMSHHPLPYAVREKARKLLKGVARLLTGR